jgi:Tfp pilus assembly PilM family ATPase/Tfp pilus assembly protein PilN
MPRFGLDIGRGSVKLVRVDERGLGATEVRAADRALDGALAGPERRAAVLVALRELAAELGARPRDPIAVAIPRAEAIVKCLSLPRVPDAELEQLVRFQAAKDLPFELSDVVLAWGRTGPAFTEGADEVVVAAVRKDAVDEAAALVREAGLTPGALEVSTQAAARALAHLAPAPASGVDEMLLVEVGRTTTDIIVLEGGRLAFSRSASVGCGADPAADTTWLERLSQEVGRSLVAARATRGAGARTGKPGALFVAGGGAALTALADALEARVGVRPLVLDALGAGDAARGARFVVARGLVTPAGQALPCLDLAHSAQARGEKRTRLRLSVALGAAAVAVVLLTLGLELVGRGRAADVARLSAERKALEPRVKKARALEAELNLARDWQARRGRELEVLLCLSRALPEDQAFLTSLRWVDGRPITLAARARGLDEALRFVSSLERDPLVFRARVETIKRPDGPAGGKAGIEFTGTCELREPSAGSGPAAGRTK